jgi:general secretion pathway protein G
MISLNRKQSGFTIVELLIVIVVIGILAGLVLNTMNGVQKKGRDTERKTDINALASQLEVYYASNNKYPALTQLQDTTAGGFVETSLKGLDKEALRDPKGAAGQTPAATSSSTQYGYAPVDSGGGACDASGTDDCTDFTLTATLEEGGTHVKTNLTN